MSERPADRGPRPEPHPDARPAHGGANVVPLRPAGPPSPGERPRVPADPTADAGDHDRTHEPRLRDVIGDVLRDERLRQDRTLADVAAEAAVSLQYLSEVERGRKEISSDLLHAVHTALGLELVDVLERSVQRLGARSARHQRAELRVGTQRGHLLLAA